MNLLASLVLAGFGAMSNSQARVVDINIAVGNALTFTPAVTNISAGDEVTWTWNNTSNDHSTTSTTSGKTWDSGLQAEPFSYSVTFTNAGTFPYFCSRHVSFGMTGEVVVAAVLLPPTIGIISPAAGTVFAVPANVTIQAGVTNGSGAVTNVSFLVDSAILTSKTVAPFTATTNNLSAGSHTLAVIATDTNNFNATNSISVSVVNPVAISLSSPELSSKTNFQFSYSANTGLQYVIQRATNLPANWRAIATNKAAANPASFTDTNVPAGPDFYRVGLLPNP